MHIWGTKAETLEFMTGHQEELGGIVLPHYRFTYKDWLKNRESIWQGVRAKFPETAKVIVRSSALNEDQEGKSWAGKYESYPCPLEKAAFLDTAGKVFAGYDDEAPGNQAFAQPLLENVEAAGVAFTADPNNGGRYYVINYDDAGSTAAVTSGEKNSRLFYHFKGSSKLPADRMLAALCETLGAMERIFETELLDVEFAWQQGLLYIFQARPLSVQKPLPEDGQKQRDCIERISSKIRMSNMKRPFLYGRKTLYSNMTDWNPAEMIGIHPKNLALSLYKELITDQTWAYQRDNYGYMRLRSFPLMLDFCGIPYIDVRVSFNSFIPADLPPNIAEKLVNYYLERLEENPALHDKAEFDIVFSCYTFDLPKRIQVLWEHGFSVEETDTILASLKKLTNRIINSRTGLWRKDREKIGILEKRYFEIADSNLDEVGKIYWLMADCKRYGTLPFAGLARAGFIAVQLLQSMVKEKIIDKEEYESFMGDVDTVGSKLKKDLGSLSRASFLHKYGHLRPGTYDITSPRYDEQPDLYFDWQDRKPFPEEEKKNSFRLSLPQMKKIREVLEQHGLNDDVLGLFTFIKAAIENRETAKFVFTRNLSEMLRLLSVWGERNGFSREDMSYADIQIIMEAYATTPEEKALIRQSVETGRRKYEESTSLVLPPLITSERDAESFVIPDAWPTYITQKRTHGRVLPVSEAGEEGMEGAILLIPSADPGFDWIFSHPIKGFVTEYGGANSHMAIRAGELQLPAVIGAGQKLYRKIAGAREVEIDGALKKVSIIR